MVERVCALKGSYQPGRFGEPGEAGVTLSEVRELLLHQIAAWPQSVDAVAAQAAEWAGADAAPGPGAASVGSRGKLLRIEPLKWWLYGAGVGELDPEQGVTLDLSHSRTHLRIAGPRAGVCLNRLVPLDLRPRSFAINSVATTAMHHVAITLWRSDNGYELFLPRGFAVSLWEVLLETAAQFGVEIEPQNPPRTTNEAM
jgi:heterotetrameric sarcosine oxidase gamma subunit